MRILVTGGREGQVARALLEGAGDGDFIMALGRPHVDITHRGSVERAIATHRPEVVVNAAAYTAVDKAEVDEAAAFAVNASGAANVANAAAASGLPVIHISTDYVFAGDSAIPYREDDVPRPLNAYGRSKLAGEEAVRAANPAHAILRTSWVFSPWGSNFARTMLRLAESSSQVRVVADQRGAPTYAPDIAEGIRMVARAALLRSEETDWRGVFHMTAAGETTWAGFAEALFDGSAVRGGVSAQVTPVATADYPTRARRPVNSRMNNSRFRETFGHSLPPWQDGLERFLERMAEQSRR